MRLLSFLVCFTWLSATAQFKNVKLAAEGENALTTPVINPSVAINRKNTKNIVIAMTSNRVNTTIDGGTTWAVVIPESPTGSTGDPFLLADEKGELYYLHASDPGGLGKAKESWMDRIICQKSDDGGTWSTGSSFGANLAMDQGFPSSTAHPKKQILYTTWTQFDNYGLSDVNCHSNIMFSMSTNGGNKWEKAIQISQTPGDCADQEGTLRGAMPAVGFDGKIYVTWANRGSIFFDRSYDGGETWLSNDIEVARQTESWSIVIPGLKPIMGRPVLTIDRSITRAQNSLYLVYADQRHGINDADIWFYRSVNRGDNWTQALRINQDEPGKQQFNPSIAVDNTTGFIYMVYYDRRAYSDQQTDVYLAYSVDGGNRFRETKISETSFVPTDAVWLGDKTSIDAHGGVIVPVWTRMDNGKTSVWTTVIKESELAKLK